MSNEHLFDGSSCRVQFPLQVQSWRVKLSSNLLFCRMNFLSDFLFYQRKLLLKLQSCQMKFLPDAILLGEVYIWVAVLSGEVSIQLYNFVGWVFVRIGRSFVSIAFLSGEVLCPNCYLIGWSFWHTSFCSIIFLIDLLFCQWNFVRAAAFSDKILSLSLCLGDFFFLLLSLYGKNQTFSSRLFSFLIYITCTFSYILESSGEARNHVCSLA